MNKDGISDGDYVIFEKAESDSDFGDIACSSGIVTSAKPFRISRCLKSSCTSYSPCTKNNCFTWAASWHARKRR